MHANFADLRPDQVAAIKGNSGVMRFLRCAHTFGRTSSVRASALLDPPVSLSTVVVAYQLCSALYEDSEPKLYEYVNSTTFADTVALLGTDAYHCIEASDAAYEMDPDIVAAKRVPDLSLSHARHLFLCRVQGPARDLHLRMGRYIHGRPARQFFGSA